MEETIQATQQATPGPIAQLIQNIETVIQGKTQQIELVLTCLLAQGHILIEDNPGSGKTVLAKTLAKSITSNTNTEAIFKRIQFTPDLLPMDLLGTNIFDDNKKEFIFKKGPLFCNILLADEINRASPKVQSALLECMAENQITVGEHTYALDNPFFTIATQNPIETEGTYPLPTAQLDRFFMKIIFGYVSPNIELEILNNYLSINQNAQHTKPVVSKNQILQLQAEAEKTYIHPELVNSVRNIIHNTRQAPEILVGASTRSGIIYLKCLKAYALIQNRNYVIEDDIATLATPLLAHRLVYKNKENGQQALSKIVQTEIKRLSQLNLQPQA